LLRAASRRSPLRDSLRLATSSLGSADFPPSCDVSGFCSSARKFDYAALRPCGMASRFSKAAGAARAFVFRCTLISGKDRGTGDFILVFPCFGSFKRNFHPIYNVPMLGAHKMWTQARPALNPL